MKSGRCLSTCDVFDSVDDWGCGVNGIRLGMAHSQRRRTELNVVDGLYCYINNIYYLKVKWHMQDEIIFR